MEFVLQRPFSLPTWDQITSLVRGLFFAEEDDDDDQSIVTNLDEPHDKKTKEGDEDEDDPNLIAGGPPKKKKDKDSEDEEEGDDEDDEDAKAKQVKREEFYQTKYQKLGKALKDRDPDLYDALTEDSDDEEEEEEEEKSDPDDRHLDDMKGQELIEAIVNKVDARAERRERNRERVLANKAKTKAKRQWKREVGIAQDEILSVQQEEGLTDEQRTEAIDWAKDLEITDPLKLAKAVIHKMSNMTPSAPKPPKERRDEATKAREIALTQQPKKKAADRKKAKTGDAKILDEMHALKPRSVLSLLDRNRK